jgi:hypothetical protein
VIVTDGFSENGDAIKRMFGDLQEKDENIHLHVISSNDKYPDFTAETSEHGAKDLFGSSSSFTALTF